MTNTVSILGETAKEQWESAIGILDMALRANIESVLNEIDEFDVGEVAESQAARLEAALRVLDSYTAEMRRLVDGVFGE